MTDDIPSIDNIRHFMWQRGDLEWKLWDQQVPIYRGIRSLPRNVDEVVILCARQFGKSHLGALLAVEDCLRYPNKCILLVGPTYKQAIEIVAPRLRDISKDAPPDLIRRSKSEGKWYIGMSELVIGGFDVNSSSQRGKTVQTIYIEEIVDSNPDDYNDSMRSDLGPALTHSRGGKMIFLTTPPKIPDHPFITDTMAKAEINESLYIFTIDDNKQLSRDQYDACIRRCGGINTSDFQREYLCRIIRDPSVVVVPDYDDATHTHDIRFPLYFYPQISIDWGGVRDRTVALLFWYSFFDNVMEVYDERVFSPNTSTQEIVKVVREMEAQLPSNSHPIQRWADAPGQLLVDLELQHEFSVQMPPKDDWQAAVNQMSVAFSSRKCRIHPRCKFTRQSLKSGTFNKHRTDFERSEALGHCDALAALMYGIRVQRKDSPYPMVSMPRDNFFIAPPKEDDMLSPRNFGFIPKKFGTFARQ